jgi:hypothetical protein
MSDNPIRAALVAACETDAFWSSGRGDADDDIMQDRARAIAAFLRAPKIWSALAEDGTESVAAAVERAAKEAGDG